jgi:plastocyanin
VTGFRLALSTVCALALAGGPPLARDRGAIRGRVQFTAPMPMVEHRPAVGDLGGTRAQAIDRRQSVVYLDSVPQPAFYELKTQHLRMDQRDERFDPRVLAITVGSTVDFPNSDTKFHNVFSLSRANNFDLGRYPPGKTGSVKFDKPGIVRVFCDIHSHMSAFILVFAHRYFAVTDDDGRYRLENVPPGTYTLTVWNETIRGDAPKRNVTVPDGGGDVDVDFSIR